MVAEDQDEKNVHVAMNEMLDYIMKMIEYVCSENEEEDRRNIKLLAQNILERSEELYRAQEAKAKILSEQKSQLTTDVSLLDQL